MERIKVNENTVLPNDDLTREYDFNNTYLKIYLENEPDNSPLYVSPRERIDLSFLEGQEIGDKIVIEIVEMTLFEYEALPEWDGF